MEVSVTILIVAVLTAILVGAFRLAIAAAKKSQCTSNMSQIGKALLLYLDDHDGGFPPYYPEMGGAVVDKRPKELIASLQAYGPTPGMWFCPLDKHKGTKFESGGMMMDHVDSSYTYGVGVLHYSDKAKPFLSLNISAVPKPSLTTYLLEQSFGDDFTDAPHGKRNNNLYLDGHVKEQSNLPPYCDYPEQSPSCPK